MQISVRLGLVIGLLVMLVGCGSGASLNDIPGSVSVDGKAPEGAVVMFHPMDSSIPHVATGQTGADGKFHVTYDKKVGIPVGKYKVTVVWPDPAMKPTESQKMMGLAPDAPDLLGGKYASKASTPLEMEVTSGMKELRPIEVKGK
jgi:hypothetical protein